MSADSLRARLAEAAHYDAEYAGGLSNHLGMALVALHRLGAGEARQRDFMQRYAQRLHAAPPPVPWPVGEPWREHLGDPRAWPAYRTLFRDWLRLEGRDAALELALPYLMPGVGAAAFHGAIRCAYALAADGDEGLADALAYWACRWFTLGTPPSGDGRSTDARAVLERLPALPPGQGLIAERMLRASRQRGFAAVDALAVGEGTLASLSRLAAQRYAAGGDSTVLHLVTGAHALRVLLPALDADDRPAALASFWRAFAAGWMAAGGAREAVAPGGDAPPWPALVAAALASDDDHVVKLVHSCREEESAYGGDDWRRAAARALRA